MKRSVAPSQGKCIALDITVVLVLVIGAVLGLIAGINYGGNYASDFEFLSYRGYEATGIIGFALGMLIAAAVAYGIAVHFSYRGSSIFPALGFLIGITASAWIGALVTGTPARLLIVVILAFAGVAVGLYAAGLKIRQYGQHWRKK